jgi:uncharacterized protein
MKKIVVTFVLVIAALWFVPWRNISWGSIAVNNNQVVTVTGEAKAVVKNEIASFSAGVSATNDNKQTAVNEVNTKVAAMTKSVKDFGVKDADIQTQNISVYQNQDYYTENGVQKVRKGAWSVNNTVDITLRDINKTSGLTDLLTQSGATNVYGPNFRVDDTNSTEKGLYDAVMTDAREKAQAIANASGRKLGKVVMVNDGGSASQIVPMMYADKVGIGGGGAPAPVEPGSQQITKSMTVSFQLE